MTIEFSQADNDNEVEIEIDNSDNRLSFWIRQDELPDVIAHLQRQLKKPENV